MNFGEKLRALRDQRGWTQEQIASKLGTSKQVISRYENNQRSPKLSVALKYAEILGVSSNYFTDNEDSISASGTIPPGFEPLPEGAESYKPKGYMPVLGCVRAGMPLYTDENIEEYIACDYEDENEYFALKIKGDSMNAAGINEGDYVVVRKQEIVENGEIAIVIVNGDDATIKRFSRQGNTVVLTPQSYNSEHKPQIYDLSEIPVRVIGKVVEARRKF